MKAESRIKKGRYGSSDAAESDISVRAARKTVGLKCRRRRQLNSSAIHKHVTESPNLDSCVAIEYLRVVLGYFYDFQPGKYCVGNESG